MLRRAKIEGAAGFVDAAVAEALADVEGCREPLAGKLVLAEPEVGDAAEVEAVGFSPGVLAVGRLGAVECIASGVYRAMSGAETWPTSLGPCFRGHAEAHREMKRAALARLAFQPEAATQHLG